MKKIYGYSVSLFLSPIQTEKRFTIDMDKGAKVLKNGLGVEVLEENKLIIYAIIDSNSFKKDKEEHYFVLVKFNEFLNEPIKLENCIGRVCLDRGTFFLFEKHEIRGLNLG